MYSAKVEQNGQVRVWDEKGRMLFIRSVPGRVTQVNVNGNLLSIQNDRGRLYVYELPSGSLKYTR